MTFFEHGLAAIRRTPWRDVRASLVVLCCGLAVTALATYRLADIERERDRLQFEKHVSTARNAVLDRIQTSVALLRGTAGLLAAGGDEIGRAAFRRYIDQLSLRERYPGVLGIGWSRRILRDERAGLVSRMRREAEPDFRLWPAHSSPEYHAILHLEPLDQRNRTAIGYDMFTDGVRAAAMVRARDSGMPAATHRVSLVQEIAGVKQPGFLIYLPVYRQGVVPASVAERREQLLGYTYSPLRAGDFLSQAFAHDNPPPVAVAIYDGTEVRPDALLYRKPAAAEEGAPRYLQTLIVDVAGTPWTVVFESARRAGAGWGTVLASSVIGIVLTLLLAYIVWREAKARAAGQRLLARERLARRDAERANLLKDDFLATLSHELRTPLNAILGWAHVVRHGGIDDSQLRAGLDAIERNAKVQVRLIDELLDMSRIISGKLHLEMQPVDLGQVAAASVQSIAPAAEAKRLRLVQQYAPVPAVRGDPSRLQQVAWNLLVNAVKFTPEGGSITVRVEEAQGAVRLTVSDTGEGIAPEFLQHVFDRFRQADASKTRQHGGLGIGLAIVRHLVELHGGTVVADSRGVGAGSMFAVALPGMRAGEAAVPDRAPRQARPDEVRESGAGTHDYAGLRVLVADDEVDARELVRCLLADHGAEVQVAASAQEALEILPAFAPHVLLSDIGMPGMDGYELIRRVRASYPRRVLAAAVSAYARSEDRRRALDAGYDLYLVKPLHPVDLLDAVTDLAARAAPGSSPQQSSLRAGAERR